MKRINHIYNKINDIDIIMNMYDKVVSKNTKNKRKIEKFNDYYSCNIINIKNIIQSKNYIPGKYNIFFIYEPKLRIIMSQNIKDKLINHLVAKYFLVDTLDKTFIETNIATRINKGTHYGLMTTKKYLNKMKLKTNNFYYLKFDISKYFYNIDHKIVKKLISNKIKDKKALTIINNIIDSTDNEYINKIIIKLKNNEITRINSLNISEKEKNIKIEEIESIPLYEKGKGFPIGNMTSQIIAILYLNELDHFIKEKLNIKYYIRYMDDGILIHENKEYLKYCLYKIKKILYKYKLKLNYKKTKIDNIKKELDFLGYRFNIINNKVIMKLRNDCKKRFKNKITNINYLYNNNYIDYKKYCNELSSYKGHLKWGNCKNLLFINKIKNKKIDKL